MRACKKPHEGARSILNIILVLFGQRSTGDSWAKAKKLMHSPTFLVQLHEYDTARVNDEKLKYISAYTKDGKFTVEQAAHISQFTKFLCQWIFALEKYAKYQQAGGFAQLEQ